MREYGQPLTTSGGNIVQCVGILGGHINFLWQHLDRVRIDPGSKVILQIGCNDLTYLSPESVVERLMAFAYYLVDSRRMTKVVICQLLHRRRLRPSSIHGSIEHYNKAVDWVNFLVQQLSYISPKVNFREHSRAVRNALCIYEDGVHLNSRGMGHYRRSRVRIDGGVGGV